MPRRTFVDSLFVIALVNRRDQYHDQALALAASLRGEPLLTTDAVLLEIGNGLARTYKKEAVAILEELRTADELKIVHLTPDLFDRAFHLYKDPSGQGVGAGGLRVFHSHEGRRAPFGSDFRSSLPAGGLRGPDAGDRANLIQ